MDVRGYLQTSVNEWPGKVSAVIWSSGCNFRCPFCQNRDLVLNPQKLSQISEKKILTDLKKRKKYIDAVVVTGGEPTLYSDLADFLRKLKKLSFLTMIETNGTKPEVLKKLFSQNLVDRISLDIKGLFDEYSRMTKSKISVVRIKESIKIILNFGVDCELRTTVVPTLHTKKSLVKLARQLVSLTAKQPISWYLQQFVPQNCLDPTFEKIKPYNKKEMKEIFLAVQKHFPNTKLRGV